MKKALWKHSMAQLLNKNEALSNLSLNLKADNQTKKKPTWFRAGMFFVLIICSKISKSNSRNITDIAHSKKTTILLWLGKN